MTRTDVESSVEAFAALCAELDDPFAARDGVLREHRLDARGFAALRAAWLERLARPESIGSLPEAFAQSYEERAKEVRAERAERAERARRQGSVEPSAGRSRVPAPAQAAGGAESIDETSYGMRILLPALPFAGGTEPTGAPAARAPAEGGGGVSGRPEQPPPASRPPVAAPSSTRAPRGAPSARSILDETAPLGVVVRLEPTLPFHPRPDLGAVPATPGPTPGPTPRAPEASPQPATRPPAHPEKKPP